MTAELTLQNDVAMRPYNGCGTSTLTSHLQQPYNSPVTSPKQGKNGGGGPPMTLEKSSWSAQYLKKLENKVL